MKVSLDVHVFTKRLHLFVQAGGVSHDDKVRLRSVRRSRALRYIHTCAPSSMEFCDGRLRLVPACSCCRSSRANAATSSLCASGCVGTAVTVLLNAKKHRALPCADRQTGGVERVLAARSTEGGGSPA